MYKISLSISIYLSVCLLAVWLSVCLSIYLGSCRVLESWESAGKLKGQFPGLEKYYKNSIGLMSPEKSLNFQKQHLHISVAHEKTEEN